MTARANSTAPARAAELGASSNTDGVDAPLVIEAAAKTVARQATYEMGALLQLLRDAALNQDDELDLIARGITARCSELNGVVLSAISGDPLEETQIESVYPSELEVSHE